MENRDIVLTARVRYGALIFGILFCLVGVAAMIITGVRLLRPKYEVQNKELYAGHILADIPYRVHLLPNELYREEWREAGMVYAELLTDYIEISPKAELNGDGEPTVTGNYQVTAVLEGYRTSNETRSQIFEKRYALASGESSQMVLEDSLKLRLPFYRIEAERMEQILGNQVTKDFYLLFEGEFSVEMREKTEKKSFSIRLEIPLGNGTSLYEISKPEPVKEDITISEEHNVKIPVSRKWFLYGGLILAVGGGFIGFVMCCTCFPDEDEECRIRQRNVIRKYGSHMVQLVSLPDQGDREMREVKDAEGLIMLSEELRQPVYYSPDADGLPSDGTFYIDGDDCCYILNI